MARSPGKNMAKIGLTLPWQACMGGHLPEFSPAMGWWTPSRDLHAMTPFVAYAETAAHPARGLLPLGVGAGPLRAAPVLPHLLAQPPVLGRSRCWWRCGPICTAASSSACSSPISARNHSKLLVEEISSATDQFHQIKSIRRGEVSHACRNVVKKPRSGRMLHDKQMSWTAKLTHSSLLIKKS